MPYIRGLDGLRALAVLAVLVYHASSAWLPGGFLGVEVFFVISGYLITALLLAEWERDGHIALRQFWLRRARRLLPALYLLLFVVLLGATLLLPGQVARLRADALAALGYVTNWYLVFGHQSYFVAMGRPSLFQHLWSLAVEEQFYLVWPLLLLAMLRWCRRLITPIILAGAVASAGWMAVLYRPGVDPSRLYYGTDTRAAGLLIGAALATRWSLKAAPARSGRRFALLGELVSAGALAVLALLCVRLNEFEPLLYRGGFALVALATAVVIAATVHQAGSLCNRLLGLAPMRWLGQRSYGVYLWHWPVFMVTRPGLDVSLDGPLLLLLRLAATFALAELSYRLVELPVRRGALGAPWRARQGTTSAVAIRPVAGFGLVLGFAAVVGLKVVAAPEIAPPSMPEYVAIHHEPPAEAIAAPAAAVAPVVPVAALPAVAPPAIPDPTAWLMPVAHPLDQSVSAVGDSVMLGSSQALLAAMPNIDIDAKVGRQASAAVAIIRELRAGGELGDTVVVHLGNNGTFSDKELDDVLNAIGDERRVVLINVRVPRPWEEPNNQVLARGAKRHANVLLVDWYGASAGHAEFFRDDGIHLVPAGARVYAGLIGVRVYADEMARLLTGRAITYGNVVP